MGSIAPQNCQHGILNIIEIVDDEGQPVKNLDVEGLALISVGSNQEILPISYSFDKITDVGTYQYHDWTQKQLIDGNYGVAPWSADLGNGHAYEWVGWSNDEIVNIDFDFSEITKIGRIEIGTVQDNLDDVVLPSVDIYSGEPGNWTLVESLVIPESSSNNNTYRTYEFDYLGLNTRYVRVTLKHSFNGPWTFVDEVDFFSPSW